MVNLWLYLSQLPLPCVSQQEGEDGAGVGEGLRGANRTLLSYMSLLVTEWAIGQKADTQGALATRDLVCLACLQESSCVIFLVALKGLITCKTGQCQGLQGCDTPPTFVPELGLEEDRHVILGCKQIILRSPNSPHLLRGCCKHSCCYQP